ncbi:LysR substrate-binding domain-containing protein [Ramlibacter sp. AN1015]|uniref:LysR substrate-binding domain-containing protein n=1 Tax=Ramlibacter sp. AN1015 TaxID=3133428 RepID=UPI0030BBC8A8
METKWLEDFVSLAETRSFSRSAQLRHVTQPAFSRRIQALEAWAGTDLVDRSAYPTRLTPAGEMLHAQALEVLQSLQGMRAMLRSYSAAAHDVVEFAAPHTLALTFFPGWLAALRERFGPLKARMVALSVHDSVLRLLEGACDLLIAYHHPAQPLQLDPERFEMVVLGRDTIAPYARANAQGQPLFRLPGTADRPLPYLAYAPGGYLGPLAERAVKQAPEELHLDPVYETDTAEGLKAMALEGHGVAWLPAGAVANELRSGRLVPAAGEGGAATLQLDLEVRAFRQRPAGRDAVKGAAQALWTYLTEPERR